MNDAKKQSEDLVAKTKLKAESLLEEGDELLSKAKDFKLNKPNSDEYPVSGLDAYKKEKI